MLETEPDNAIDAAMSPNLNFTHRSNILYKKIIYKRLYVQLRSDRFEIVNKKYKTFTNKKIQRFLDCKFLAHDKSDIHLFLGNGFDGRITNINKTINNCLMHIKFN